MHEFIRRMSPFGMRDLSVRLQHYSAFFVACSEHVIVATLFDCKPNGGMAPAKSGGS